MWVSRYLVWFVTYSVLGWVYESAYCTVTERRWENRGFLYGPLCPIYGTGVVAVMAAWQLAAAAGLSPTPLQVFLAAALGSAVLEYATSWALERLFHARWWDYSDLPLNLNGRICLPATILFGLAGLLVAYVLLGPTVELTDAAPPEAVEALSLVLVALVAVDTTLTVSALTRFAQAAAAVSDSVNAHMDQFVDGAVARGSAAMAQLQESVPGRAAASAAETVREAGAAAAGQLQERGQLAAEALAEERERFAAAARASRLGEMGQLVSAAAARIKSLAPVAAGPASPSDQRAKLLADIRRRRGGDPGGNAG